MGRPLTARQQQVYDFIDDRISQRGFGPTVREIGEYLGIKSPNGVMCHLRALERKGMINRMANKSRAIELTNRKQRMKPTLGVMGEVGQDNCNLFETPTSCDVMQMLEQPDHFLLRYTGNGLDDWSIASGDILIVQSVQQGNGSALEVVRASHNAIELQAPRATVPQPHLGVGLHVENNGSASAVLGSNAPVSVRNDTPTPTSESKQLIGIVVGLVRTQLFARRPAEARPCSTNPLPMPLGTQQFKICNWQ